MLNATDERRIIEHLKNDSETELMPHDLSEILEQELSKPEEEMDSQLIREIMELLETEGPSPREKEKCWQAVQGKVRKKRAVHHGAALRWMCAAVAALAVVFFVSFETARAFNWTFLLKHLGPIAETFGLYSTGNVDHETAEDQGAYRDEFTEYEQLNYSSLEEMPTQLRGQSLIPSWVPERFHFVNGAIYEDENMASATLYYSGEENACLTLILSFYNNDEDVTSYMYEMSTPNQNDMTVENHTLTYYFNDDGEIRAISDIEENAHFFIGGTISEEELARIAASMNP